MADPADPNDCSIAEFPLGCTGADEHALTVRFDAYRQIFNAGLGEALRRLDLMRESRDWRRARAMPKHLGTDRDGKPISNKARTDLFRATIRRFGFTRNDIEKFVKDCKNTCWIGEHVSGLEGQAIAARAFNAVQQYAFGRRGRPRFKGVRRLRSVEGKSQKAGILLRWRNGRPVIEWGGLSLPLFLDPRDRDGWQADALSRSVRYCRIVRRTLRGRDRWHVQLVLGGAPFIKARHAALWAAAPAEPGALDLGPSTVAVIGQADAVLTRLCPGVDQPWAEMKRLQRALDRSQRACNPQHFNPDGTIRKGGPKKRWVRSRRYRITAARLAETERRLAATRKTEHGALVNWSLGIARTIKMEKISLKSFQKCFGRSVKVRAPGLLIATLSRKAGNAGGKVEAFSTRTTRLSQYCHMADAYVKKPLKQRHHAFPDGTRVQRDLYSAFLARFVRDDKLDANRAREAWSAGEPLLRRAASSFIQSASVGRVPRPPRRHRRRSGSSVKTRGACETV